MQIPPNSSLLNLVSTLPVQGAAAGATPASSARPPVEPSGGDTAAAVKPSPGQQPRGKVINIVT